MIQFDEHICSNGLKPPPSDLLFQFVIFWDKEIVKWAMHMQKKNIQNKSPTKKYMWYFDVFCKPGLVVFLRRTWAILTHAIHESQYTYIINVYMFFLKQLKTMHIFIDHCQPHNCCVFVTFQGDQTCPPLAQVWRIWAWKPLTSPWEFSLRRAGGWKGAETAVVFPPSIFLLEQRIFGSSLNIHVFFCWFILLMEVRQSTTCNV